MRMYIVALVLPSAILQPRVSYALWATNGLPMTPATTKRVDTPSLVSDGAGGAILVWHNETQAPEAKAYALRFMSNAAIAPGWPSGGVVVDSPSGSAGYISYSDAVTDGAGGALVRLQFVLFGNHLYVKRVFANGTVGSSLGGCTDCVVSAADDGVGGSYTAWWLYDHSIHLKHNTSPDQAVGSSSSPLGLAGDGAGGAFIAWPCEIQHYDAAGSLLGGPSLPNCGTSPVAIADGSGGVFLAWYRQPDIMMLRLTALAEPAPGWNPNGVVVGNTTTLPSLKLSRDAVADGALLSWLSANKRIYVQRVTSVGSIASGWSSSGTGVGPDSLVSDISAPVADGHGGAYVAWTYGDAVTTTNIYAQHLIADGTVASGWGPGGSAISLATGNQRSVTATTDGNGGVYIAWLNVPNLRIYAQHVLYGDTFPLAVPGPDVLAARLSVSARNPVTGSDWSFSVETPSAAPAKVTIVDASGRVIESRELGRLASGANPIRLTTRPLAPGVYMLRVEQSERRVSTKVVVTR